MTSYLQRCNFILFFVSCWLPSLNQNKLSNGFLFLIPFYTRCFVVIPKKNPCSLNFAALYVDGHKQSFFFVVLWKKQRASFSLGLERDKSNQIKKMDVTKKWLFPEDQHFCFTFFFCWCGWGKKQVCISDCLKTFRFFFQKNKIKKKVSSFFLFNKKGGVLIARAGEVCKYCARVILRSFFFRIIFTTVSCFGCLRWE